MARFSSVMAIASDYVLQKAVLEIKYRDGVVYLDHCGSLMVALQKVVGEPFRPNLPNMEYGELKSFLERLVIRFGPENFVVDQSWLETPARLQKLAPLCWAEVAKVLSLENKVTRCGLRIWAHWAADSLEEAQAELGHRGFVVESPTWLDLFGPAKARSFVGVSNRGGSTNLRAELSTVHLSFEGHLAPDEKKFAIPYAIQADLDMFVENPGKFSPTELRMFLDNGLTETRKLCDKIGGVLHAKHD